jgi:hypothetical protein
MRAEPAEHARNDEFLMQTWQTVGHAEQTDQQSREQYQHDYQPDESERLAHDGEYRVVDGFWEVAGRLYAVTNTYS